MCLADPASPSQSSLAAGGGSVPAQGGAKTPGAGGAERFLADLGGALVVPRGRPVRRVHLGSMEFGNAEVILLTIVW